MKLNYKLAVHRVPGAWGGISIDTCYHEYVANRDENIQNRVHYINCGNLSAQGRETIKERIKQQYPVGSYMAPGCPENQKDGAADYDHLDIVRYAALEIISVLIDESSMGASSLPAARKQQIRRLLNSDRPMEQKLEDICELAYNAVHDRSGGSAIHSLFSSENSKALYQNILDVASSSFLLPPDPAKEYGQSNHEF